MEYISKSDEIVVVGCGVIGLTVAIILQENGFNVKVISDRKTSDTTSNRATAIWFPYGVDFQNDTRIIEWGHRTYNTLDRLSKEKDTFVSFVKFVQLFKDQKEFQRKEKRGFRKWTHIPRSYHHPVHNLPVHYEYGYEIEVPLMDTQGYLSFLANKLKRDIKIVDKINHLAELSPHQKRIVNCTGVRAGELVGDNKVYPSRGQVVVIKKSQSIDRCYYHLKESHTNEPELTYIIPRDKDCILGGTAEKNNWCETPSTKVTHDIIERCKKLHPALNLLREEDILDVKVGLRPGREKVRLEFESVSNRCGVIHNYGHGGAGFTLSWGCAEEVLKLALEHF